jgi:DNA-binding SARP family transcriptional activator
VHKTVSSPINAWATESYSFQIEWVDPTTGLCLPLPAERLHGRGVAPALGLLKALLCRPRRFATRDWLLEQFWPETTRRKASERLDDVVSGLRTLLRVPGSDEKILHFVYGSNGKGNGYQLTAYPTIWVDADAFEWHMKQAGLMERFGDDPLPFLEAAYQLGERGTFLAAELYSQWSEERRHDLNGQYGQCAYRMADRYRQCGALLQAERCLIPSCVQRDNMLTRRGKLDF